MGWEVADGCGQMGDTESLCAKNLFLVHSKRQKIIDTKVYKMLSIVRLKAEKTSLTKGLSQVVPCLLIVT